MPQHALKLSASQERRQAERRAIRFVAHIAEGAGKALPVKVLNISRTGFMAETGVVLKRGARIAFAAPNGETFSAIVRWAQDGRIGCAFATELGWEDLLGLGLEELDSDELPRPARRKPGR